MTNTQPDPHDNSPVAWLRISAMLRERIETGELPAGKPAPSITALVQAGHAKARATCAKALQAGLVDAGLLLRYPGLGYYVADLADQAD